MENQHRKISGYRDLSQAEIDLMNEVKAAGAALLALHEKVRDHLASQKDAALFSDVSGRELERIKDAEPVRWASIAKTDIQTGVMALVRAIAQPGDAV